MIIEAHTDPARQEVLDLFLSTFTDISSTAVPMTDMDSLYAPLVVQYRDDITDRLLGGALTCRAQVAAGSIQFTQSGLVPPGMAGPPDFSSVLDKHSELDLMAVAPEARGQGVGGRMLMYLEGKLHERGVRVWFGNVTRDMQVSSLDRFYSAHGFTVLGDGQPLPDLLGKPWGKPGNDPSVAFYFYKLIARSARSA